MKKNFFRKTTIYHYSNIPGIAMTLSIEIALLIVLVVLAIISLIKKPTESVAESVLKNLGDKLLILENNLTRLEKSVKEDLSSQRLELTNALTDNRKELNENIRGFKSELQEVLKDIRDLTAQSLTDINKTLFEKIETLTQATHKAHSENRNEIKETLRIFGDEQKNKLTELTLTMQQQLEKISSKVETNLQQLNQQAKSDNQQFREALTNSFKDFQDIFDKNVRSFNDVQREKFAQLESRQNELVQSTEKKLETIRQTVEEKLDKTLSDRLGQSFETVGKQLLEVQKGLGEMQSLAADVGGLKKVLSNVKLRGGVGEVQLAMLLENILAPSQYEKNVRTKPGSSEPVEFAIKLPGKSEDDGSFIYLPIDAKFPKETFERLLTAYESGNPDEIEVASRNLENTIRKMASDISEKYIYPPNTTDFAILFLPFESIYAEVIRRSALVDQIRDKHKVIISGPTTFAALLNSLQIGFRTLAIQKRSSEVWKLLGAVKTEFEKFGDLLNKARKNIQTGLNQIDEVAGKRSRAISSKLRNVELLPPDESVKYFPEITSPDQEEYEYDPDTDQ
ncbi:DNA recombination protein RmuC [Schleiferia thermophila]|uniref:DNA recombination protein RmuC n=2 Tax=Schleiferia thermophila TaxID=884107 RepID=UPI002FDA6A59